MAQQDFKPQGYLTVSNIECIEIELNDAGDAIRFRTVSAYCRNLYGNVSEWQELKFDDNGEMYFYAYSNRYYLNQFIRYETT